MRFCCCSWAWNSFPKLNFKLKNPFVVDFFYVITFGYTFEMTESSLTKEQTCLFQFAQSRNETVQAAECILCLKNEIEQIHYALQIIRILQSNI